MSERIPPQKIDAEQGLIGACLITGDMPADISPESFYRSSHAEIYRAIQQVSALGEPVDALSISDELRRQGKYDEIGGRGYLEHLIAATPTASNADYYAGLVREAADRRAIIQLACELASQAYDEQQATATQIAEYGCKKLLSISHRRNGAAIRPLAQGISEFYQRFSECYPEGISTMQYIPTGVKSFDGLVGGFPRGELAILAARPGMGKTAFILNMADNIAQRGNCCYLVSSEQSEDITLLRMIARQGNIESNCVKFGPIGETIAVRVKLACDELVKRQIFYKCDSISVAELRNDLQLLAVQNGKFPDAVFIDRIEYFRELDTVLDSAQRVIALGEISKQLARLAQELNIPIILIQQLSRECEKRPDKRPTLRDLRASGMVEENAKLVIFLYRDEYYGIMQDKKGRSREGICEVIIGKQNNGALGTIEMSFRKEIPGFYELERRYDDNNTSDESAQTPSSDEGQWWGK
jgi:replicative DNA helicase